MELFDIKIEASLVKGIAHAVIMPVLVTVIFATLFISNYAILAGIAYLALPALVYHHKVGEAGAYFYSFATAWPVIILIYLVLILAS